MPGYKNLSLLQIVVTGIIYSNEDVARIDESLVQRLVPANACGDN